MTAAQKLKDELQNLADEQKANHLSKFFKTGKGQYAEDDKFLGINVPVNKSLVKKYYKYIALADMAEMLHSPWHEYRFAALQCMVMQYEKADDEKQKALVEIYLNNLSGINNWDLVDCSAHKIIGAWAVKKQDLSQIENLADSHNLWQERIAVVASWAFIKNKQYDLTLKFAVQFRYCRHLCRSRRIGKHLYFHCFELP